MINILWNASLSTLPTLLAQTGSWIIQIVKSMEFMSLLNFVLCLRDAGLVAIILYQQRSCDLIMRWNFIDGSGHKFCYKTALILVNIRNNVPQTRTIQDTN